MQLFLDIPFNVWNVLHILTFFLKAIITIEYQKYARGKPFIDTKKKLKTNCISVLQLFF